MTSTNAEAIRSRATHVQQIHVPDDAVARILNAAMNWENAIRGHDAGNVSHAQWMTTEQILREAVSEYMPLVAK